MLTEQVLVNRNSQVYVVAAGVKSAGGPDDGYHFVFMPSHLFPAYPSYRWWAVIVDRSVLIACSTKDNLLQSGLQQQIKSTQIAETTVSCCGPFGGLLSSRMFAVKCILATFILNAFQESAWHSKRHSCESFHAGYVECAGYFIVCSSHAYSKSTCQHCVELQR